MCLVFIRAINMNLFPTSILCFTYFHFSCINNTDKLELCYSLPTPMLFSTIRCSKYSNNYNEVTVAYKKSNLFMVKSVKNFLIFFFCFSVIFLLLWSIIDCFIHAQLCTYRVGRSWRGGGIKNDLFKSLEMQSFESRCTGLLLNRLKLSAQSLIAVFKAVFTSGCFVRTMHLETLT